MPNTGDDQKLDRLILSFAKTRWQKTALIIAAALDALEAEGDDVPAEAVANRIEHLVKAGMLEAQGDVSRWRSSELRLPEPHD